MFDLRYHVASLAAVFVALLIGILVGVGLTGKVDDAEKTALRKRAEAAERHVQALGEQRAEDTRMQDASRTLASHGYPLLIDDVLRGRRVALLFVGSVDGEVRSAVARTVEDAGALGLTRMRALDVPVDTSRVDAVLAGKPQLASLSGTENLDDLGRMLAQEFVVGGDAPAWDAVTTVLVEAQRGRARPPVQGVVIARSAGPQSGPTARFLTGLYAGLAEARTPVVGVESVADEPSAVPVFDRAGLPTVDNVDTEPGRLALALLLAGAPPGNYGVKETADDILPEVGEEPTGG